MAKVFLFFLAVFFSLSLYSQEKPVSSNKEPIPIPDVEGIPVKKEKQKLPEEDLVLQESDEMQGIERHRFFNVRSLPLAEGFANRPSDLANERLLILGRVQLRGMSGQRESVFNNGKSDYNSVDWNFRRVRLGFMYEGGSWWGMQMHLRIEDAIAKPYITTQTDPNTGNIERVSLRDNRGTLQQANMWFHIPYMESMLVVGMFRLPFLREWNTAANMMTPERSYTHSTLHQFDLGVQYVFYPMSAISNKYKKHVLARISATNGAGAGHEGTGRRIALNETRSGTQPHLVSPMYHWRLTYEPFGGFIKDGYDVGWHEGEEIFQSNQRLSIGVGGAHTKELQTIASYDPSTRGVPSLAFLNLQTTPSGGRFSPVFPEIYPDNTETTPFRREMGIYAFTYDFTYTVSGYYASAAYTRFSGPASNDTESYNCTLGYVMKFRNLYLMPTYRYDVIEGDFNRNGRRDPTDILRSHWVGLNVFADRHLMKFQLFYQIQKDKFGIKPITNGLRDMDNNLVYFQAQMTFWSGTLKMED